MTPDPTAEARAAAKEVLRRRYEASECEVELSYDIALALDAFAQERVERAMAKAVKNTDILLTIERESFLLRFASLEAELARVREKVKSYGHGCACGLLKEIK